ncbi:ferritin-like domain-containing protein [Arthrobacter sp. D3-18]
MTTSLTIFPATWCTDFPVHVTPWSVVNGQTSEKRRTPPWGRVLLVAVVALLVAGTGMVLIPRDSGTPPAVPFSETARVAALEDTQRLRESATLLAEASASDAGKPTLGDAVTLLTTHAQALQGPNGVTSRGPSSAVPATADQESAAKPTSRASFLTGLAASGQKRLDDAREADGGIARLLAAVGTAQLLQAESLAAEWQLPLPLTTAASDTGATTATPLAASCPSVSPTPEPTSASTDTALAAVVRSQQEAIYVYQVALKRVDTSNSAAAAKYLQMHEVLLQQAESLISVNCADAPAGEAGYRLPEQFAQDPAAFLGSVELASLPRLGDLVALSTDETRMWAVDCLLAAARRSAAWGAPLPALPGLMLDAGELPSLPTPTPATSTSNGG